MIRSSAMKHTIVIAILAAFVLANGSAIAGGKEVNCYAVKSKKCMKKGPEKLPKSVDEFLEMRERLADDPYGGAQMLIYALMVRLEDPDLADQMIVLSLDAEQLNKSGKDIYKGYSWKGKWSYHINNTKKYDYCVRAFADSVTDDGADFDENAVTIRFRQQDKYVGTVESGEYKVFACNERADSCKPITLTRNKKGVWKVKEFSSVVGGCRKPEKVVDYSDDL